MNPYQKTITTRLIHKEDSNPNELFVQYLQYVDFFFGPENSESRQIANSSSIEVVEWSSNGKIDSYHMALSPKRNTA